MTDKAQAATDALKRLNAEVQANPDSERPKFIDFAQNDKHATTLGIIKAITTMLELLQDREIPKDGIVFKVAIEGTLDDLTEVILNNSHLSSRIRQQIGDDNQDDDEPLDDASFTDDGTPAEDIAPATPVVEPVPQPAADIIQDTIIRIYRDETSSSKSPMWRVWTDGRRKLNIFQHKDTDKNDWPKFAGTEWEPVLQGMEVGDAYALQQPIEVRLVKNGKWTNLVSVGPLVGRQPRYTEINTDPATARREAVQWAKRMIELEVPVFDVETTGFDEDAEIIRVAIVAADGRTLLDNHVKPRDLSRVEDKTDIHGITPDMLADAPAFAEVYDKIKAITCQPIGKVEDAFTYMAYNSEFDTRMFRQEVSRLPNGADFHWTGNEANCAMRHYAMFAGQWDKWKVDWTFEKLTEVCDYLGIAQEWVDKAHDPVADCQMTLALVKWLADQPEEKPEDEFPF